MTSTEHFAWSATASETLPMITLSNPLRPCDPTILVASNIGLVKPREPAKTFETAAHIERFQHFAEEAELAGLVGSDADNLRDAIKGESYEVETMYRQFSEQ